MVAVVSRVGGRKLLFVFFALSFFATIIFAQEPTEPGEFTLEQFYQKPTYENFWLLNLVAQQEYVATLNQFSGHNFQIAADYFAQTQNINVNKQTFNRFMQNQGVDLTVVGDVKELEISRDGSTLSQLIFRDPNTKPKTEIDIAEFKGFYAFRVEQDGSLRLISRGKEHIVTGSLQRDVLPDGRVRMLMSEGTVAGKGIKEGRFWISGDKITGSAATFGTTEFLIDEGSSYGNFVYDQETNVLEITNPFELEEYFFKTRGKDVTIRVAGKVKYEVNGKTLEKPVEVNFIDEGEKIASAEVTYDSLGRATRVKALTDAGGAMLGGVEQVIRHNGDSIALCYSTGCVKEKQANDENYFYYGEKEFRLGGKGFNSIMSKQRILDFKRDKLGNGRYTIKKKLWAEDFFLGSSSQTNSDYYDYLSFQTHDSEGGSVQVKRRSNDLKTTMEGSVLIENGYWEIIKWQEGISSGKHFNPSLYTFQQGLQGRDVMPMTVDFIFASGKKQEGYQFVDKSGEPDLFYFPFRYTGIAPGAAEPRNQKEFEEYMLFNAKLLEGLPLDFDEGRQFSLLPQTNEFVCVDVARCMLEMTTGKNIAREIEQTGGHPRKLWSWGDWLKSSPRFETTDLDGNDIIGSDPALRGTWQKSVEVDSAKITLTPSSVRIPALENLEPGVYYMALEKHYVKEKGDKLVKVGGNPRYHMVPFFVTEDHQLVSYQAPGQCSGEGICTKPLIPYLLETRNCRSSVDFKYGCVAHVGINSISKVKFRE